MTPALALLISFAMLVVAGASVFRSRQQAVVKTPHTPHPSLVYTKDAIARRGERSDTILVDANPSLGMVRLVERSRARMLFIFSRAGSVSYVGASLRRADRALLKTLEAGATLVPDGLLPERAFAADRCLPAADALRLLEETRARAPRAVDRIVCASADAVALDLVGSELVTGSVSLDLNEPLTWRPLAFHEGGGGVGGVFQGTWVDQGAASVVFISPLPALTVWRDPFAEGREPEPFVPEDPAADAKALELSMSPAADPPPTHLRVSVDALLMFPLREALAHAGRAKREHAPWHRRATMLKHARG
jgi:hypothetical protein